MTRSELMDVLTGIVKRINPEGKKRGHASDYITIAISWLGSDGDHIRSLQARVARLAQLNEALTTINDDLREHVQDLQDEVGALQNARNGLWDHLKASFEREQNHIRVAKKTYTPKLVPNTDPCLRPTKGMLIFD